MLFAMSSTLFVVFIIKKFKEKQPNGKPTKFFYVNMFQPWVLAYLGAGAIQFIFNYNMYIVLDAQQLYDICISFHISIQWNFL